MKKNKVNKTSKDEAPLRGLITAWRRLAPHYENGLLLELCAFELERLLDKTKD